MNGGFKHNQIPVLNLPKNDRVDHLNNEFLKEFRNKPSFFVKVPGRVNIIGEHIDYCGYPVLPMAIEQDILIAVGLIPEHELHFRNTNQKYCNYDVEIKPYQEMEINPDENAKPYWYNYVLCGVKGALEHLNNDYHNGVQYFIDGNIPPASGLSSSSALVSAACLAFLYGQNECLSKPEIASLCANSERYIGTQGGGMDQAIAFLAEKYSAQYITWNPLNATAVSLPENAVFVVAHSAAEANKAATNDFNRRVIECRLAAKMLAALTHTETEKKITLSELQSTLNCDLEIMVQLVKTHLSKDVYTKAEVCTVINISEEEMNELHLTANTMHLNEFKLKQRALHVYEEAIRVENFRKACGFKVLNGSSSESYNNGVSENNHKKDTLEILGKLMLESHESLKNLYECSHDNLDHLVELSKGMNICSRLTGAGWGGCIVALCPKDRVSEYIRTIKCKFYEKFCNIDQSKSDSFIFATTPNHGAVIYKPLF